MKRLLPALLLVCSSAWGQSFPLLFYPSRQVSIPQPTLFLDFVNNTGFNGGAPASPTSFLTLSRTQTVNTTDLTPISPAGYAYQTFSTASTFRITPGLGLLIEGQRINQIQNSTNPTLGINTTASLATGTYTLWMNTVQGQSATTLSTATMGSGTGVGCGTGVASQGNPVVFTITTAGTCTVNIVRGSTGATNDVIQCVQLELGPFGSSCIVTAATTGTRTTDIITVTSPPAPGTAYSFKASMTMIGFSTSNQTSIQWDDGVVTNRTQIFRFVTNNVMALGGNTGLGSQNNGISAVVGNLVHHAAVQNTNYQVSSSFGNNTAVSTAAFTPPTNLTTMRIGGNNTVNNQPCYCYLADVSVWPTTQLTLQQLQQITR